MPAHSPTPAHARARMLTPAHTLAHTPANTALARAPSSRPAAPGALAQDLCKAVVATAKSMGIAVKNFRPITGLQ